MGLLSPLASLLGQEIEGLVSKARTAALVWALIGLFCALATGFLIAAGFMVLADMVGPIMAALIFAGSFLGLALIVYLGALIARSRRRQKLAERRRANETGALLTTAAITALPLLAKSPGVLRLGLPIAAIAAIALLRDGKKSE